MNRPDVDRMLTELSWDQFCGWLAFYQLEPWGGLIEDRRAGNIAAALYNVNRVKRSSKLWSWVDFITGTIRERKSKPMTEKGWKAFKASLLKGMKSKSKVENSDTPHNDTSSSSPS